MNRKTWYITGNGDHTFRIVHQILCQAPESYIILVSTETCESTLQLMAEFPNQVTLKNEYDAYDLLKADYVIFIDDEVISFDQLKRDAKQQKAPLLTVRYSFENGYLFYNVISKKRFDLHILATDHQLESSVRFGKIVNGLVPEDSYQMKAAETRKNSFFPSSLFFPWNYETNRNRKLFFDLTVLFFAIFFGYALSSLITFNETAHFIKDIPSIFYIMLMVGFFAQLVDGAVGLGYGITCSSSMMLFGVQLPSISGSIHPAEMFSSGISGYSHYRFGNVHKKLFWAIMIPGVVGAVSGAQLLIYFGGRFENITYGLVCIYLFIIGIKLIRTALKKKIEKRRIKNITLLGFMGGFLDAFGGGGWGPVVTSTLLSKGKKSNLVVGTVSLAEFFVTLSASVTFFAGLGLRYGYIVAGLIIGGGIAAPIAAKLAGKIPQRTAIFAVAILVMVSCIRILVGLF